MIIEALLLLTLVVVCIILGIKIGTERGAEDTIEILKEAGVIRLIPLGDGDFDIVSGDKK